MLTLAEILQAKAELDTKKIIVVKNFVNNNKHCKIDNDELYRNNMLEKFREIKDKLSIESEKKLWMIAEDLI